MGALAKRRSMPNFRRGPSPKLVKLQSRLSSLQKRARERASGHEGVVASTLAPVVMAMAQKHVNLPTVAGIDKNLLYGGLAYIVGPKLGGKTGQLVRSAGQGLLAVGAAASAARGGIKVSGDEDEDVADLLSD